VFLSRIANFFSNFNNKYYGKKSFTYYIPAPPQRKNGYQEKEFDQIFNYLMQKDFDIIDFKLISASGQHSSGMWIVCLLGALSLEALEIDLEIDYAEIASMKESTIKVDPSIEHEC
jgi:hypothetical protein